MDKILVPVDFSPGSDEAMRIAVRLANESAAELVIAHAWYVPAGIVGIDPYTFTSELIQKLSDDAQRNLDDATRRAADMGAKKVSAIMLTGVPPWARIVDLVETDPAFGMVVMGTHGRTGAKRFLLGSVAEKVVRHSPCSVLVARGAGPSRPFTSALCPVDFSQSSRVAIEVASQLVQPGGAGITLLHVVEAPVAYTGEAYATEFLRDLDTAASRALEDLAAQLRDTAKVQVTTKVSIGFAGQQTLAVLDEDPAFDLVVMGSHGRTGIRRALLGSVAEKVVRHARCPVLIARRRPA